MRIYPLRTSSDTWDINIYSAHICTEDCKYSYMIEPINEQSSIMFIFENPDYNITNEMCQYHSTINKSSVKLSIFDKSRLFTVDGNLAYHNQIVIPDQRITIELKFPLRETKKVTVKSTQSLGFTLSEIIFTIKKVYEWIYKKEEETSTEQEHTIMTLCSCMDEGKNKNAILENSVIKEVEEVEQTCPICLDLIENECLITKCNHSYHKDCFLKWMDQKETCPTCRQNLFLCNLCNGTRIFYVKYKGKVIPKEMRGVIGNRNTTDGIFGIYGYDFDDLYLKDMTYNSITQTLYPNIISI